MLGHRSHACYLAPKEAGQASFPTATLGKGNSPDTGMVFKVLVSKKPGQMSPTVELRGGWEVKARESHRLFQPVFSVAANRDRVW